MNGYSLGLHVQLVGFKSIDYDKKPIRKRLRQEGGEVRNVARQLIARRAISHAGEFPGMQSGLLRRSVRVRALRGELAVLIEPSRSVLEKAVGAKDAAYPWILAAGTAALGGPRADYVEVALNRRKEAATSAIADVLQRSLVPR